MKKKKVLYVVNLDATTSIPLEVAAYIAKEMNDFRILVYYDQSKYPPNTFTRDLHFLKARHFFDFGAILRAVKFLRAYRPDVIHAHHTISAFVFFYLALLFNRRAKLVKTEHNNHHFFKGYQNFLNFFVLLAADKVICNSQNTADTFSKLEKMVSRGKIVVVHNGVNIDFVQESRISDEKLRELTNLPEGTRIIGSVGRLVPQKDYDTLIKAFHQLYHQHQDERLYLVLVGDGSERDSLERLCRELAITDRVVLTGALGRDQVYQLLQRFEIFVMPSLWEGFCNTIVEAMAAELPIVCSDIPTLKEVVQDAAHYAPAGDELDFAEKIGALYQNLDIRQRLSQKAAERVQKYGLHHTAERYKMLYEV